MRVESEQRQDRRSNLGDLHPGTVGRAMSRAGQDHQDRHAHVVETPTAVLSVIGKCLDGTSPEVRLDGVPGGDGPAFAEGFYIVTRDNEGYPGSVIIEQR
jgi:hypothetical protein